MKKLFFLFTGILLASVTVKSQLSIGPRTGLNISKENYTNTADYSTSSHNFFTAGVFANYRTQKNIAFELSVNYSPEGTHETIKSGNTVTGSGVVTIKRINIPLLVQYHTKPGIYFETGPQIGLLSQAYGDYTTGHYDFKANTRSSLASWVLGAGYQLTKHLTGLGINASYAKGLSHTQKGTANAGNITASTFSIKLFYGFQIKKKDKKQ